MRDTIQNPIGNSRDQTQIQTEPSDKSFFERFCPCLHPTVLKPYFDVSTKDIKVRLLASLMPFNQKFYQEYSLKPDLYGPFWILWTLVVILTISGNFARYLEMDDPEQFTYTFKIIPISAAVLFGIGIGLPLAIKTVVQCFGHQASSVPTLTGIGIYAYSFSSFLISSILCGFIPNNAV